MRHRVFYVLVLAAVASVAIVSAGAAECRRVNGPYGYYGDLWCKEGGNKKAGASTRKRANQERAHRAERKKSRSKVTKKVDATIKSETAESESRAKTENENSSIASATAETEKTSERTALESETKGIAGSIGPTDIATCKKFVPSVEAVSRPCQKGEADSGTCKQYIPTVETVSVPCE